tara:strand:- start:45 stop:218 length:174 start_codon:yes stop_codon:yes gene_type:complete
MKNLNTTKNKADKVSITPLQKHLISWGLQSIRFDDDSQIKSARNLAYKLGLDIKIDY